MRYDDPRLAQMYLNKISNAEARGVQFDISFAEYRHIMNLPRCEISGAMMTAKSPATAKHKGSDVTIDRVDCSKGYTTGNCIACCWAINHLKGQIEDPTNQLSTDMVSKLAAYMTKHGLPKNEVMKKEAA